MDTGTADLIFIIIIIIIINMLLYDSWRVYHSKTQLNPPQDYVDVV